jgi:hypothetical protein
MMLIDNGAGDAVALIESTAGPLPAEAADVRQA